MIRPIRDLPPAASGSRQRVAFYSHDSFGLGHLRRSLSLAGALADLGRDLEILVVTGSPRALFFSAPASVRVEKFPAVTKDDHGQYISRNSELPLDETVRSRKRVLRETILSFAPDVLVVDHTPAGLRGELLPLLADLRHHTATRLILGLRDIIDEPRWVRQNWRMNGIYRILDRLYHHVWVYGDRNVFSLGELYRLPRTVGDRLLYLGYLGHPHDPAPASPPPKRPRVLCLVGGGGDGFPLARCFVEAMTRARGRHSGTLITGPFISDTERRLLADLAYGVENLQILRFTTQVERMLAECEAVITMGGYNSLMESLSQTRRTLVVPRVFPRREQWLRARAFEDRGLVRLVDPRELAPDRLLAELDHLLAEPSPPHPATVGLAWEGTGAFAESCSQLLASSRPGEEALRRVAD